MQAQLDEAMLLAEDTCEESILLDQQVHSAKEVQFPCLINNKQAFHASIQPFAVSKPKLSFQISPTLELYVAVGNLEAPCCLSLFSPSSGITSSYIISPSSSAVSIDKDLLPSSASVLSLEPPLFLLANFVIDHLHFARPTLSIKTRRKEVVFLSTRARIVNGEEGTIKDSYLKLLPLLFYKKYVNNP
jgi:hypothetical protein